MRTIPEVRARLIELAKQLEDPSITWVDRVTLAKELRELAEDTKRRPQLRRAKAKLKTTSKKLEDIREFAEGLPDASYQELAEMFDTTIGRISEALRGKREHAPHTFERNEEFREAAE